MKPTGHCQLIATLFLVLMHCASCANVRPKRIPIPLDFKVSPGIYKIDDFDKDLSAYRDSFKNLPAAADAARRQRDVMINRIMLTVEMYYGEYKTQFLNNISKEETAADVTGLALSAGGTVTNGQRGKTILAAIASGVQGSQLSFNKNFFREKTAEIILAKMDALRDDIRNQIIQKMSNLTVDKYTFEEAWSDLVRFYYAGTLQAGLIGLSADAGASATQAIKDTQETVKGRLPQARGVTADELAAAVAVRDEFNRIFKANDVNRARSILTSLGHAAEESASPTDVFKELNDQIGANSGDLAGLQKLKKAFGIQQ